jgi:signal transduction histidine kinase
MDDAIGAARPDGGRGRDRSWLVRTFGPLFSARTWRETTHLLLDLPFGILWFTCAVTFISVSAGVSVTVVGLPLLMATVAFGRVIASSERGRCAALLGTSLPSYPRRPRTGSGWASVKRRLGDGAGWRGLAYGMIMLPWGIIAFTLTVVVWSVSLGMATLPAYAWAIPDNDEGGVGHFGSYVLRGWGYVGYLALVAVVGLLFLALAPRIVRGLAAVDRALIRSMLSPNPNKVLEERVEALTVSRDASVEGAAIELRRIERDLHDGAQQRLVSLAMNLGIANDRLASGADPATAALLVGQAHDEAKQAITELRELVRGIHPAVLTDRGLDAALSALAARSLVPMTIEVNLSARPPAAVEGAAYFVVAEAMSNIAKHSRATCALVRITTLGRKLLIDVYDDGRGGAIVSPTGGLAGLQDRVRALEGSMRLSSPEGGPTELRVELPL